MRSRHVVGIDRQRVRQVGIYAPTLNSVTKRYGFHNVAIASLMCAAMILPALPSSLGAMAMPTKITKSGSVTLFAKPVKNLNATSARINVRGTGFDPRIGIYVALCVTPPNGSTKAPGPCGGGVNLNASSTASVWISSNPPPYGTAIAIPFKSGGRFTVTLTVNSRIGEIDCKVTSCSIVTRADHTKPSYRGADLFIPVTFK